LSFYGLASGPFESVEVAVQKIFQLPQWIENLLRTGTSNPSTPNGLPAAIAIGSTPCASRHNRSIPRQSFLAHELSR